MRRFLERSWRIIQARYSEWRSALFILLLFLILVGLFRPGTSQPHIVLETSETSLVETTTTTTYDEPIHIRSYITGAVRRPGVYSLPRGSILQDLVIAAGGFIQGAQEDAVNLALEISDQAHYHIPDLSDETLSPSLQTFVQSEDVSGSLVNLNTAGLAELQTLNGIGPALAQRILDWRESYGPFQSRDELMLVPGIKEAKYQALEHQLATIQ